MSAPTYAHPAAGHPADATPHERDGLSARASHSGPSPPAPRTDDTRTPGAGDGYPPQMHAGKVGYGPHYGESGASIGEKLSGLKDEALGKAKKDPALVAHGRELRTGELKRRQQAEADAASNPFASAEDPDPEPQGGDRDPDAVRATTTAPAGTDKAERQLGEEHVARARV